MVDGAARTTPSGGLIHGGTLALALLDVPKPTRTAIHLSVSVVARRNRAAMAIFPGVFWRARPSSSSVQPHRLNSSAIIPKGMNSKAGFLVRLGWRLKKILPIHVVEEDFFVAITTANNVVNSPMIFHDRAHLN